MKILDLHINGFGKLVDFEYHAEPGMNLVFGENEFGKSTLLAFIRAMLYGFGKRSSGRLKDFDRRKYAPWGHFSFGGSMNFLHEGIVYRLERSFGASRAEDLTALSVLSTGTRIDLVTEEPGAFLFRMEESEFVNTVYIGQLATSLTKSGRDTDTLSARLINLSQSADENISYDEVDARILSEAVRIKASRGQGGILPRLIEELEANSLMVTEIEGIRDEVTSIQASIHEKILQEKEHKARHTELSRQLSQLKQRAEKAKQEQTENSVRLQTLEEQKNLSIERLAEREREAREFRKRQIEISSRYKEEIRTLEADVTRAREDIEAQRNRFADRVLDLRKRMRKQQQKIHELQQLIVARHTEIAGRENELLDVGAEMKKIINERDALRKLRMRFKNTLQPVGWLIITLAIAAVAFFSVLLYLRSPWIFAPLLLLLPCVILFFLNRIQLGRVSQRLELVMRDHESSVSALQVLKEAYPGYEESLRTETQHLEQLYKDLEDMRRQRQSELLLSRRMLQLSEDRMADLRLSIQQNIRRQDNGIAPVLEKSADESQTADALSVSGIEAFEVKIADVREQLSLVEVELALVRSEEARLLDEEAEISTGLTEIRVAIARLETATESVLRHMPEESRVTEEGQTSQTESDG